MLTEFGIHHWLAGELRKLIKCFSYCYFFSDLINENGFHEELKSENEGLALNDETVKEIEQVFESTTETGTKESQEVFETLIKDDEVIEEGVVVSEALDFENITTARAGLTL